MSKAEKFIQEHTKKCSNQYDFPECFENGIERLKEYQPWVSPDQARKAVEIVREEMIEKAIKWVEYNNENGGCKFDGWIENIKQAMKDE